MFHLAANILLGYCSSCGSWLGSPNALRDDNSDNDGFEMYAGRAISELVAGCQGESDAKSQSPYSRQVLCTNLKVCIDSLSRGVLQIFADSVGLGRENVEKWLRGETHPPLGKFLTMTYALGESAHMMLLSPTFSQSDLDKIASRSGHLFRQQRAWRSPDERREALHTELKSDQPRSLRALAESLGYNSIAPLYRADRDLFLQLSARYREFADSVGHVSPNKRKCRDAEMETSLRSALLDEIPPRLLDVARRMGYAGTGSILARFPKLSQRIIQRRKSWEESQRRILRKIMQSAISEVPPSTVAELSKRYRGRFSEHLFRKEVDLVAQLGDAVKAHRQQKNERLQAALEAALAESPAPTLRMMGDRLECSVGVISNLYPKLASKVAARGRSYKSEVHRARRKALDEEVLSVAKRLIETGIAPRNDCIIPMLSKESLQDWYAITRAIHKARHALGSEPVRSDLAPRKKKES
jgi:hypothetical protein